MKIAVLMGGLSKEREVSLRSGAAISSALKRKGYDVLDIDVDANLIDRLQAVKPEAVYIALHGKFGEDGVVQGLLEWLRIPYTSSSLRTSAICFDKLKTKEFMKAHGITSPDYQVSFGEDINDWINNFTLELPVIVKPNTEGSSIGVSRVFKKEELFAALQEAHRYDSVVLVEHMIVGREVTVGVLNGQALPVVEVIPKSGFYDFNSKYTKGFTEYQVPAKLEKKVEAELQKTAAKLYKVLQCEGGVRADFMIDENDHIFCLEVNTIPGMTETSLMPKAAACAGISFDDLCERIMKDARLKI